MSDGPAKGRNNKKKSRSDDHPPLVVIGASAGGIRALQSFFDAMPADSGAAFAVVVHLDPEHRSELPRILAGRTAMPVVQVEGRQKLAGNRVYVIPPDRHLEVVDHEISAQPFDQPRGKRSPIDSLFRSVAERLGDGFAVILSGAGSDGAIGVRALKESGGIILVQDPNEAEYGSMPRSAIATGVADLVLPVDQLALRLADLIKLKEQNGHLMDEPEIDEDLLRRILAHLRVRTGHDFSKYKRSTVLRRIARRLQVTRTDDLRGYYDALRESTEEAQALLSDLLISVTTFFRDADSFEQLQKTVMPELFGRNDIESVRVWVAGCATGEEAYSIAMLLLEEVSRHELRPTIQVFGSDLDARALTTAREGRYPVAIEADVSEERLRRFFTREGEAYRIRQEVRDIVLFAAHDLVKDPPFSHVDLISCRNVLIYLDRELQEQVCGTFHYALKPGGYLMLGASESADHPPGLFRMLDRNSRLYQSTALEGEKPRLLPSLLGPVRLREQVVQIGRHLSPTAALSEAAIHRRALEKVAPPSILVDETHRVLHMSATAGRYVQPSGGPLSNDVVDLVRTELRFELRSALHRLFEQRQPTLSLPILVRFNGHRHRVHLHVKAPDEEEMPHSALIMFVEGEAVDDDFPRAEHEASNETVRRLTQELELTQSRLRTVREESDAANEELRAANEELQSINEEYRSTSEELETSKEELQSINEELQTVNSELKLKLETISRAHSDLQNLMAATDFGTLFLDSALRIKRFTDPVTALFSITPADEGRPITDFAHQLEYKDLTKDARAVLTDLAPVRREISSRADRWYDVRMRPYRTVDDKIDGVVITFVDVTERRNVEEALRSGERQLEQQRRMVELSREPIFVWDVDTGIVDWNRGCEELYGYSRQEALGKRSAQLLGTSMPDSSLEQMNAQLLADGHWDGELRQRAKDGRMLIVEARLDLENVDGRRLVLESSRDVTQRRSLQERQQLLLGELTHRVKNTLAVVQAIAHQTELTSPSPAAFVERFSGRLAALANAHSLLVQTDWQGADLAALTRVQLQAYASDATAQRLQIEGPAVLLPAELATPFGLVLHELATNAAKYGALARPSGRIGVSWDLKGADGKRVLRLHWRETGGAKPENASSTGLGSQLIEHAIPGAKVRRQFDKDGLSCTIELPLPSEPQDARIN
ncbi:MAG TPA: CheR family methyltransferase [Steroidobacteraceae bacterium]|nr:CheR family methyltransferase [Steroidobacteraceae bacterium]